MANQAVKMGLMFLGGLALMAAVSVVNENDYVDRIIDPPQMRRLSDVGRTSTKRI